MFRRASSLTVSDDSYSRVSHPDLSTRKRSSQKKRFYFPPKYREHKLKVTRRKSRYNRLESVRKDIKISNEMSTVKLEKSEKKKKKKVVSFGKGTKKHDGLSKAAELVDDLCFIFFQTANVSSKLQHLDFRRDILLLLHKVGGGFSTLMKVYEMIGNAIGRLRGNEENIAATDIRNSNGQDTNILPNQKTPVLPNGGGRLILVTENHISGLIQLGTHVQGALKILLSASKKKEGKNNK
eukprot:g3282.t1